MTKITNKKDTKQSEQTHTHHIEHVKNAESKHNIMVGLSIVSIVLLFAISFQIGNINDNLKIIASKLDNSAVKAGTNVVAPSAGVPSAKAQAVPTAPTKVTNMAKLADDDAVKGNADAPVTIVEFSDYQCPFCGRFYKETLGQIDEQYIKTGKVKLIYRDVKYYIIIFIKHLKELIIKIIETK